MKVLKLIVDWGAKIQLHIGAAALFAIVVSMTAGVITRFFGHPFDWTEELCTVLFVWLSFMGAGVAAQQRRHICVDYIVAKVSPKAARTVKIVTLILVLVFLVVLFGGAVKFLPKTIYARTVALGIPRTVSYIPVAICSFYMFFAYLYDLLTELRFGAGDKA
ncbi:MAG: TRAP transporter small permease subunit [Candidatus Adiutrix sp.]|nr:TRAP transporter small permease subunit [Candidatus Adiutrix sp.]